MCKSRNFKSIEGGLFFADGGHFFNKCIFLRPSKP